MTIFRPPVSGVLMTLRPLTGTDEAALAEAADDLAATALLITRLTTMQTDGGAISATDADALIVTDADAFLLHLRRSVFGDRIQALATCPNPDCAAPIDVSFSIAAFLAQGTAEAGRESRGVRRGASGWYELAGAGVEFRPPTLGDQRAAALTRDPAETLRRRCIRWNGERGADKKGTDEKNNAPIPVALRRRCERAIERIAPDLGEGIEAICPDCGATVELDFNPRRFTLTELRQQAAFLYGDVHLLAMTYHWTEESILALPRERRIRYAELARTP